MGPATTFISTWTPCLHLNHSRQKLNHRTWSATSSLPSAQNATSQLVTTLLAHWKTLAQNGDIKPTTSTEVYQQVITFSNSPKITSLTPPSITLALPPGPSSEPCFIAVNPTPTIMTRFTFTHIGISERQKSFTQLPQSKITIHSKSHTLLKAVLLHTPLPDKLF